MKIRQASLRPACGHIDIKTCHPHHKSIDMMPQACRAVLCVFVCVCVCVCVLQVT